MTKASQVAAALRTLADALDKQPELSINRPLLAFYPDTKEEFMGLAKIAPRPLKKNFTDPTAEIEHRFMDEKGHDIAWFYIQIPRNKVCDLVEPAKPAVYRCEPIFSEAEEAAILSDQDV